MKYLTLVITVLAAVTCSTVSAQTIDLQANIPFEFRMGNVAMPAGEYRIQSSRSGVVLFRGQDNGRPTAYVVTLSARRLTPLQEGRLQFHRYGEQYFLTEIWPANSSGGSALARTPQEKELAARNGLFQTASIAARRN